MKNLVFNLRTAKAQAGCAKVTKSSRMAKILTTLTLLLSLCIGQMWAGTRTIYFDTNGYTFKESATNFAVYLWNDQGNEWVTMDLVSGTIYSASIPDSRTKCVFCAVDSYGATGWDHRKAQTDDQTLSAYNLYTVTSSNKNNGDIRGSWSTYSATFSVTYNGNGKTSGSVPSDATSYSSGGTVTVSGKNTLAKTGYTFAGWNTAADGSGTYYAPGATFSITANTTLYAIWYDNKVLGGTNVMFYVESYKTPIHLTNGSAATNLAVTTISSPVGYINIAKTNLSTYYYITDNQSGGWAGDPNNGIKSAKGGEKFVKKGLSNVAAKTASTTASVTGDVLNLSTTCNSATGVYNSKSLYILYYLNSELIGVSYNSTPTIFVPAATTARASTYNVSGLSNGSYTLKTILTDGLVYYIADSDEFTVSHATNTLTVSAGTGISAVTGTTNNITAGQHIVITATVATGYTWSTWTKTGDGTLSTFTAGTKNQTVTVGTAGNMTLTASATERMSSLSTSCSYSSGSPGYAAPTVSGSATTVGYVTMRTITATTPGAAYTLSSWTITNGTRTDGGAANASSITIRSNGNGSAVTVTANYTVKTKVRLYYTNPGNFSTPKAYFWDNSNTSDNNGWAGDAMTSTTECGDTYYYVEYYKEDHPNWNRVIFNDNGNSSTQTSDITFSNTTNNGQYNNAPASRGGTGSWSATPPARWAVAGSWDSYSTSSNLMTCDDGTLYTEITTFTANTDYQFKLYDTYTSTWYGVTTATKITYENKATAQTMSNTTGGCPNQTIKTAAAGTYRFIWDPSNKKVTVNYPTSYKVELEVGTVKGNARTPKIYLGSTSSESNVISSGSYVAAGSKVIFWIANDAGSAPAAGYDWWGFYNNAAGTGSGLPEKYTDNTVSVYTINSIAANAHVYAVFGEINYWITPYINGQGSISPNGANAHIATPTEFTANPGTGYMFDSWEESGGSSMTIATPSVATTNVTTSAAATLQANFSPRWSVIGTGAFGGWTAYDAHKFDNYAVVSTKNVGYNTITLAANTSYEIKIYDRQTSTTYGGSTAQTIDYSHSGAGNQHTVATTASPKSVTIQSAAGGSYTLNWNLTDKKIAVVYPTSWYITTGQSDALGGSFTAVDNSSNNVKGGKFVANDATVTFTANKNTGYTFDGWFYNADYDNAHKYVDNDADINLSGTDNNVLTLSSIEENKAAYAKFTAKTYTVTLTRSGTGYGSGGTASVTATYNQTLPAATMPTAANGYAFMGYYTAADGEGSKIVAANGTWQNVDGYTSGGKWVRDADTELFAYFKKAEITAITFDAATVETSGTVRFTVTVAPTPVETTKLCFTVLHSNDNPLENQPTITYDGGTGKYSFTASETSGTYKVEATLRTGSNCDGGTELDTEVASFQVAGLHTVTVQYKCGDATIKESITTTGRPLDWSDEITAPEIFGYTFWKWVAEDGVSITTNDGATTVTETTTATIKIKAIYDGRLVAKYQEKSVIYFKNTLGWSDVYVHFLDGSYWNATNGSGNKSKFNCNKHMTRIGETDIWYFDYGAVSITPSLYIAFTSASQNNVESFAAGVSVVYTANYWQDQIGTDKSAENGFKAATPMYVPLAGQTKTKMGSFADYYNRGYWTKYTPGTGYSLKIYNSAGNTLLKHIAFTSEDELMPMTAVVDLEANTTYKYEMMREGDVYYGNDGTMDYSNHGQSTAWDMTWKDGGHKAGLTTTASGDYTFNLSFSENSSNEYRMRIAVDYPIKNGDYRLVYTDDTRSGRLKPSAIVPMVNNGKDTVSFFVRKDKHPQVRIQKATVASGGAITWAEYPTPGTQTNQITGAIATAIRTDSVYNFNLSMNESGALSVTSAERYLGDFYIRTDAETGSKWDNYKTPSHTMTYSQYSEENSDYTHYWMAHVWGDNNTNIKFVIANDYSPCISDTMIRSNYRGSDEAFVDGGGIISAEANIRFMWNKNNNSINRAYLSPAKSNGSKFLVLRGTDADNLLSESGAALTGDSKANPGNNHGGGAHCMQFSDDENWIYEATVKVKPESYVKLYARFAITVDGDGMPATYTDLYYKGNNNNTFDGSNAIKLITGDGDHLLVRVIYDFKTDRLLAAYLPSGNINSEMDINADVMFIREHQGDIAQVTFSGGGKITDIKTAYAVMRFNKWTLNNKSKTGSHEPLASPLSRYERDLFYISFPFDVNLNEVFGFGTYGTHWIIEEYDGASRAAKGFWKDSPTFWKFITNRNGVVLHKNVGYLLALDLDELGVDAPVWGVAENETAELFFPSSGTMPDITSGNVTATLPEHTCTIVRDGADRRIADSHWNIMGVPTYVNTTNISFANTTWTTETKDPENGKLGPQFLYTWNASDNTLTPTTARGFTYHAMHAYTVQYYGNVTWTTSVSPSSVVARQQTAPTEYEWCLELQQNEKMIDRTYVRMSDEEEVTTGFEFGYDMSKDLNRNKANIYSYIGSEMVAGNSMPLDAEHTTIVPLGVVIASNGEYTFSIPDGTNGIGITLIDEETGIRTSLSALDYTVELAAGNYTERFWLEISPVKGTETGIDPGVDARENGVRKVLIDGILYIVRDGKMYDATGKRVE